MDKKTKIRVIAGIAGLAAVALGLLPAIPQNPRYHAFADTSEYLGIPNFWNVVSNLPFLLVGGIGLLVTRQAEGGLPELKTHYTAFFIGILLTGLGSGYYHWHPDNASLVWDRLPMTIAFMAFFAIIIGEHIDVQASRHLLWPLLLAGVASVVYWHWTESQGQGDLRPYLLVQFLPMLIIPLILFWLPSRFSSTAYMWWVVFAYGIAKVLEYFDHGLFQIFGFIGGHPLKHIAATLGAYSFCMALSHRTITSEDCR